MNTEFYIILGVVSWLITIVAVSTFAKATFRFNRDTESHGVFISILHALIFMSVPYTMFILRDLDIIQSNHSEISYLIYVCMIVVGIFFFKAANMLDVFSKKYSFNYVEKRRRK